MGRFWPIADVAMTKPTLVIGRVFGKKTNLNLNINSACNIDASAKILMSRRQKKNYIKEKYFFFKFSFANGAAWKISRKNSTLA